MRLVKKLQFCLICQRTSSQKPCGIVENSVLSFFALILSGESSWISFLLSQLSLKKWWIVCSDTDVPWPWSSGFTALEVFAGYLSTIHTICMMNVKSIFLIQPHPWRLATLPWTLNFLIIFATVVTGTAGCWRWSYYPYRDVLAYVCIFHLFRQLSAFAFSSPCSMWCTWLYQTVEWLHFFM